MDLAYGPRYEAFRQQVRDFAAANRDKAPKGQGSAEASKTWQNILMQHGYAARTIPTEYGGYGAAPDILESRIIAEEFIAAGLPMGIANQGVSMLVPTLLEMGTEAQKKQYIEPTLRGEIVWCQGYSEPGSGSDLASLATHAVVDGDDFVINGQKIWTSSAHFSDMIFCLVRTEPDKPKHHGISYLLFSMKTPGIEVRPLVTMTGQAEFNEVFFTDVRVPKSQIVGERGQGWQVANATLKHERGMLGDPNQAGTRFKQLVELVKSETVDGQRLIENPIWRDRLLKLQARVLAMEFHGLRLLTARLQGENPGVAGLIVKLMGCELNHQLAAYAIDALGEIGVLYAGSPHMRAARAWQWNYMFDLGLIIGGGTAQIQKNIISERGLGMPRANLDWRVETMDFGLTADQKMMQDTVGRTLERACPLDRVRKAAEGREPFAADVWAAVAETGAAGLIVPEEHGGVGLTLLDAALTAEMLGRHVAPVPFVASCVMAPLALMGSGSPAQQGQWLPKLAAGEIVAGVAVSEAAAGARDGAGVTAANGRLTGKALFVLDAGAADIFIVADQARGLHLVRADAAGLTRTALTTIDATRSIGELAFDNVEAEPLARDGPATLARMIDAGRIVLAADILGASERMIEKAVAYASERKQFGRVIGSFQAVKHLCAEMIAELEPCRSLIWYAAYAFDETPGEATLLAAHAKAHLSEVGTFVARTATEVHGGIGFTDLLGLHYWFKRIGFDRQMLGGPERVRGDAARVQGWV